jgi:hypothetical protein
MTEPTNVLKILDGVIIPNFPVQLIVLRVEGVERMMVLAGEEIPVDRIRAEGVEFRLRSEPVRDEPIDPTPTPDPPKSMEDWIKDGMAKK